MSDMNSENDVTLADEERLLLIKLAARFETLSQFWHTPSGSHKLLADECERDRATLLGLIAASTVERPMTIGWISVTDRLPKADSDVLLTDGEEVVQAWYEEDDGWQAWHTSENWRGAKAWMPLPEPPEVTQ